MQDKWIKRMEQITSNAVWRALQKQKKELEKYLKEVGIPNETDISVLVNRTKAPIVEAFIERSKRTMNRYYAEQEKRGPIPLAGLSFNLPAKPEWVYMKAVEDLHLSDYKGSISATTKDRIKELVAKGIREGQSRVDIAKNIQNLDPQVFSKNRADLIAINQIGKAKQYGEYLAHEEYHKAGYLVLKYWSTVNDSRVTRSHTANQSQGWIELDKSFSGTGDKIAPASNNPRCRCAVNYETGDLRGAVQPKSVQMKYEMGKQKSEMIEYFKKMDKDYDYAKDTKLHTIFENWEGSGEQYLHKLAKGQLSEEAAAGLYAWKGTEYGFINDIVSKKLKGTEYDGLILGLQEAVDSLPRYYKPVWHGFSDNDILWKKLENIEKGDIIVIEEFLPTTKKKSSATSFGNNLIYIENPKTGGDLGDIDKETLGEDEVLFKPGLGLKFKKIVNNIYHFTEE